MRFVRVQTLARKAAAPVRRSPVWPPDERQVALAQGAFNVVGGLWPLLSIRSFEAVYGPKADRWLEYTVAGLLVGAGATQCSARTPDELRLAGRLGRHVALTLLMIDLIYVPKGRIRITYLQDAVCEAAWLVAWRRAAAH
jgi:hypothetical protein